MFQIKIQFDLFDLNSPNVKGQCSTDFFLATGGSPVPQLCGLNTGQHCKISQIFNVDEIIDILYIFFSYIFNHLK
jgi:hypothetical protein